MYHFILLVSLSKVVVHLTSCALFKGFLISTTKLNFKYPILFSSLTFFFPFIGLLKTFPRHGLLLTFASLICESEVRVVEVTQSKTGCLRDTFKGDYGYTRQVDRCSAENFIYHLALCFFLLGPLFPEHKYDHISAFLLVFCRPSITKLPIPF